MTQKPTYEESEQTVKELQREVGGQEVMIKPHIILEILKAIPGTLNVIGTDYNILMVGGEIARTFGNTDQIIGKKCHTVFQKRDNPCPWCKLAIVMKRGDIVNETTTPDDPREKLVGKPLSVYMRPLKDKDGNIMGAIELGTDITQIRKAEEERKRTEDSLRQREAALEIRTNELKESNNALRVMLRRMDEGKREFEEKVSLNIKELVVPYAVKLKKSGLATKQMKYLSILESNLNKIVSPFVYTLSSKYLGFTPTEIQIASLVRDGRTTKEIGELLNSSERTIECHRRKIRMKIGINNKKTNLRSFLLSI